MTRMKKCITFIAFFGLVHLSVHGSPFTILFPDGAQFRIHQVELIQDAFQTWQENSNPLKGMFFTYNYPADLEAYKSIFYKQGFPEGIDTIYATWRPSMNTVTITPQCIYSGMLDGMEIACIQYYYTHAADQVQMSFLAKRVEGKWYPVSSTAMAKYQPVMALMATLQPDLVSCLLSPDPRSTSNEAAETLRASCMTAKQQIPEACLYEIAEKWGMSDQPSDIRKEALLFKKRYSQDLPESRRASMDQALSDYVHSLGIPEEGSRRALYYFSKNETMRAVWILRAYGLQTDNTSLFAALNRIQETSHYRAITYKPQQQLKAN